MSDLQTTLPKGSLILVTGATGFVASHVTKQFLERGYKVRGTVRDLSSASWLTESSFSPHTSNLELVAVPDLSTSSAFDEAIKGVDAVAHIATITTLDPNPHNVVPQTVAGVTNILEAAAREPSVKEVVFTSSVMAATFPSPGNDTHVVKDTWNDAATQVAYSPPPYTQERALATYAASKTAAEKELWRFVKEQKPHFVVNSVNPAGIIGEPLHKKHADSPVAWIPQVYLGNVAALEAVPSANFIDVEDVAAAHVAAILDPDVKQERYHIWGPLSTFNPFLEILRKLRPEQKFIPNFGETPLLTITTDESDTLALLKKWTGRDGYKSLEQSIKESLASPYFPN